MAIVVSLLSVLVATGVISPADQSELVEATTRIVEGIFGLIMGVSAIVAYIRSRTKLKYEALRASQGN